MIARTVVQTSANPLDATMTRAQVVRRKFKSSLPRKIENRRLSPMEALGRTFELFDRLRNEMEAAGLDRDDTQAGLIYCQPETKGKEQLLADTVVLPKPGDITRFCDKVLSLDKPLFLGVLFLQRDYEATRGDQQSVVFVSQFMSGPDAEGRLIMARNAQVIEGFKGTTK